MRTLNLSIFILVFGVMLTGVPAFKAAALKEKGKPQTVCPVQGGEIDKSIYTDYKGYRIYFCCKGCPEEFHKNPEKYMKKLRESGVTLEKTPGSGIKHGEKSKPGR